MIPRPAGVAGYRRLELRQRLLEIAPGGRRGRSAATVAVTTAWWSGGTSTSTPLSVTTWTPSSRCCSGGSADGAGGRVGASEAARRARRCLPRRRSHRQCQRAPGVASGPSGDAGRTSTSPSTHALQVGDDLRERERRRDVLADRVERAVRRQAKRTCHESAPWLTVYIVAVMPVASDRHVPRGSSKHAIFLRYVFPLTVVTSWQVLGIAVCPGYPRRLTWISWVLSPASPPARPSSRGSCGHGRRSRCCSSGCRSAARGDRAASSGSRPARRSGSPAAASRRAARRSGRRRARRASVDSPSATAAVAAASSAAQRTPDDGRFACGRV